MQPYFFTALPGLWLGLKYQSQSTARIIVGIIISVIMVNECSKHQILLIGWNNMTNKGQVSKSLISQLLKKQQWTATSKCHSKRSVCHHSKESVCNLSNFAFLCSLHKNMCDSCFYFSGSVCIVSSLIVS